MNFREREALDRHITGNYGEDQFTGSDDEDQRTGIQRRKEERCECGHGPMMHPAGERCYGSMAKDIRFMTKGYNGCTCVEYLPQADRRSK